MKKLVIMAFVALGLVGCGKDTVYLNDHNDRITELERRADLNDQLDAVQNQRLDALEIALVAEQEARETADLLLDSALQQEMKDRAAADDHLAGLLALEEGARIAGDESLADDLLIEIGNRIDGDKDIRRKLRRAVFKQSIFNRSFQRQINRVRVRLSRMGDRLSNLRVRVNSLEISVEDLEKEVADVKIDMAELEVLLQVQIDDLSADQLETQAQLDAQGVQLYKCNSSNSTERLMKINGYFYGVMNRVKTQNVTVITGSSSQTYTTPDMCKRGGSGNLYLKPSSGCKGNHALVPGSSVTVPAYSTQVVKVVTEAKMALDILPNGNYITTDGGSACSFSISGNGTAQSGLIPVQGGL